MSNTSGDLLNHLKKLQDTLGGKGSEELEKCKALAQRLSLLETGVLSKFRLDSQVAFVTGGGQGIGREICHALGEAGAKVAVADLFLERAQTVQKELEAKGIESIALKVDVSKKDEVEQVVAKVIEKWGDLHIGVNNAGIVFHSDSEMTSEKEWNTTMGVNLNGVYFCCQAEAKHMLKKGYGKIINTASMSGTIVNQPQRQAAYNTSKAAVIHLTKSLAAEFADRNVNVNCISPGYVDTPLNRSDHLMVLRQGWIESTPMKRLADVGDLVGGVLYLASRLSNYTTGLDMIIDGGFTLW